MTFKQEPANCSILIRPIHFDGSREIQHSFTSDISPLNDMKPNAFLPRWNKYNMR